MPKYIFFEEGHSDSPEFSIDADNYDSAFDKAYESYGPQVISLFYRETIEESVEHYLPK